MDQMYEVKKHNIRLNFNLKKNPEPSVEQLKTPSNLRFIVRKMLLLF